MIIKTKVVYAKSHLISYIKHLIEPSFRWRKNQKQAAQIFLRGSGY